MQEAIKNFARQFEYNPKIVNEDRLGEFKKFIAVGMGGSHLSADLLKVWNSNLGLTIHNDYGLPPLADKDLAESLIILNSYSGNTEEVLDAFDKAKEKGLARAAVSVGGKLIEMAEKDGIPFVRMPQKKLQPRMALGYNFRALLKLIRDEKALKETEKLAQALDPLSFEEQGKTLAEKLANKVPIFYSSLRNLPLALNWKVKFNETAKIPAFYNVFPELNHNEMTGFDVRDATQNLSANFHFIILKDPEDPPKILKRMDVLEDILRVRNFEVDIVEIKGENIFYKIFSSMILADWSSYYLARHYEVDPEAVPMVEEFKKLIA